MEKSSQPQVLILGGTPKPKLWERLLSYTSMIGGGLISTYYGVKAYASPVDVTKDASWEGIPVEVAPVEKPRISQLVSNEPVGGNRTVVDAASRFRKQPVADAAAAPVQATIPADLPPNVALLDARRAQKQSEPVNTTPLAKTAAKAKPEVISGAGVRQLCSGRQAHRIVFARDQQGVLSAKLQFPSGDHVFVPQLNAAKLPNFAELANGMERSYSSVEAVDRMLPHVVEQAVHLRQSALMADKGGAYKATWGAIKKLDGFGKINVAGMALLGVALGGFAADIAKSVVHGISHMGTATPDTHKQR